MKTHLTLAGFVIVAAAIGGLEYLRPEPAKAERIVITQAEREFVQSQVQQAAESQSPQALDNAMSAFIEEEILYREGRKLGLDQDDLIVKRRVVQKMRFMLEDMTPITPPTDAQLQQWLEQHQSRYMTGRTLKLEHHFFSRGKREDAALFAAQQAREILVNKQGSPISDPFPLGSSDEPVDEGRLVKELGSQLAARIMVLPLQEWSAPMGSSLGVHVVKVLERSDGRAQTLEEARARVKADLMAEQREAVNEAAIKALRSRYTIEDKAP